MGGVSSLRHRIIRTRDRSQDFNGFAVSKGLFIMNFAEGV